MYERRNKERVEASFRFTTEFLIRAVGTVVRSVTELLARQTDGVIGGTHVVGQLAHHGLAVLLVRVVLAVTVPVAHPGLDDAASCGSQSSGEQ